MVDADSASRSVPRRRNHALDMSKGSIMAVKKKGTNVWLTLGKQVALPIITAVGIAVVDVGLLSGHLGLAVKSLLLSLQSVA